VSMSEKSVYKVRKEKQIPFEAITDDYRAVKKDIKAKVSALTLQYLNRKGVAKFPFYSYYKEAADRPEDRKSVTERNVIEHINGKFIEHYERI